MFRFLKILFNYGLGRVFGKGDLMLYITGYPARSRNRLYYRHTATAIWPLPYGHYHMATATRPPPYGHRYTVIATRPSHPWLGYVPGCVPGYISGYILGYVISYVPGCDGTFNHRNLLRAFSLKALLAAFNPLVPTATFSLWLIATFSSWLIPFVNLG